MNVNTSQSFRIEGTWVDLPYVNLIEINNALLILLDQHCVNIYDINMMELIKKIPCELEFIGYSQTWDVLITSEFRYFGLTPGVTSGIHRPKLYGGSRLCSRINLLTDDRNIV